MTKMLGRQLVAEHIGDQTIAAAVKLHRHDLAMSSRDQNKGRTQPTYYKMMYTHLQTPKKTHRMKVQNRPAAMDRKIPIIR